MNAPVYFNNYCNIIFPTGQISGNNFSVDDGSSMVPPRENLVDHNLNDLQHDSSQEPNSIPLPDELTNMFKPLKCELCGVAVDCPTSAYTHYEGKVHIKNVNAYMKEQYNLNSLKLRRERFSPVKCDVCNVELKCKVFVQQHFSGKQHLKNLKKKQYNILLGEAENIFKLEDENLPPPPPPPKLSDFVCEICNISTNTQQQLIFHQNGRKHKRKIDELKELNLNNEINLFYSSKDSYSFTEHVSTEDCAQTQTFVANSEMDYPLQFECSAKQVCDDLSVVNPELSVRSKWHAYISPKLCVTNKEKQTSLEEKTSQIPINLDIADKKLLASTGIFLKHLSLAIDETNEQINYETNLDNEPLNVSADLNSTRSESALLNSLNCEIKEHKEINSSTINNHSEKKYSNQPPNEVQRKYFTEQTDSRTSNAECTNETNVENTEDKEEQTQENVKVNNQKQKEGTNEVNKDMETILPENQMKVHASDQNYNNTKSKLDQVLTKLALEEFEKEGNEFGRGRLLKQGHHEEDHNETKYTYDKAGYRINREVGDSNTEHYNKWWLNSNRGYYNQTLNWGRRNSNNNWENGYHHFGYKHYYHRSCEEESKGRCRTCSDDNKLKKRNKHRNHSSDEDRGRNRVRYKYNHSSYRKRRSYSSESTNSEVSNNSSRGRKHQYSDRIGSKYRDKHRKEDVVSEKRHRNRERDKSGSSNGSGSSTHRPHDYKESKTEWCERRHKCKKAYYKCPLKHKERFKAESETERGRRAKKQEPD